MAQLIAAFPDLAVVTDDCPRGCTHAETEPECALDTAVADGTLDLARVESYRRLFSSRKCFDAREETCLELRTYNGASLR